MMLYFALFAIPPIIATLYTVSLSDWIAITLTGTVLVLVAIVIRDGLVEALLNTFERTRRAWYAPLIETAHAYRGMTPAQLAAMGRAGVSIEYVPDYAGNMVATYRPRGMSTGLDENEMIEELDRCWQWDRFPELPPQNGQGETLDRNRLRLFTRFVVELGLAEDWRGPKPAQWLVTDYDEVLAHLRLA